MQIVYEFLVFKYPVIYKQKKFHILNIFIEINVNVCLLCAHHLMTSIILHTQRHNSQQKSVTHLVFMFQVIFFSHF